MNPKPVKVKRVGIGVTGEEMTGKPPISKVYARNGGKAGAMASKDKSRRKKEGA